MLFAQHFELERAHAKTSGAVSRVEYADRKG